MRLIGKQIHGSQLHQLVLFFICRCSLFSVWTETKWLQGKLKQNILVYLRSSLSWLTVRVVPIQIPVLENAADTAKNTGIGICEYASLCTYQICYILAAKQYEALMLHTWNQYFSAALKRYSESDAVLPLATMIFKSGEKERKEPTEPAIYLHSAKFYTGKSKEMCKELFFIRWYQICTIDRFASLGSGIGIREEKKVLEHLY